MRSKHNMEEKRRKKEKRREENVRPSEFWGKKNRKIKS